MHCQRVKCSRKSCFCRCTLRVDRDGLCSDGVEKVNPPLSCTECEDFSRVILGSLSDGTMKYL